MAERKYRDKEWLKKQYGYKKRSCEDIGDELGVAKTTVYRWVRKYDLNRYRRPWDCPQLMHYLYVDKEYSTIDLCKELDGTPVNILNHLEKHGIETRTKSPRKERVSFYTNKRGYEVADGGSGQVYIHQLVAIANGESPYKVFGGESNTHHLNGIPWDNRSKNLERLSVNDHAKEHYQEREIDSLGRFA